MINLCKCICMIFIGVVLGILLGALHLAWYFDLIIWSLIVKSIIQVLEWSYDDDVWVAGLIACLLSFTAALVYALIS